MWRNQTGSTNERSTALQWMVQWFLCFILPVFDIHFQSKLKEEAGFFVGVPTRCGTSETWARSVGWFAYSNWRGHQSQHPPSPDSALLSISPCSFDTRFGTVRIWFKRMNCSAVMCCTESRRSYITAMHYHRNTAPGNLSISRQNVVLIVMLVPSAAN